jgi:DNA-directed RNA polymerase subunit M/transcription elongation factor TFIIS
MRPWYDDIDTATLQRIKTYSAFNDPESKNLMVQTMYEYKQEEIAELEAQIEKMKCCENCGWFYLQQHWRESEEINESRMFHCGTCGNKRNWKLREIKEK